MEESHRKFPGIPDEKAGTLTVSDNGAGYSPDKESTAREGPGGIGLTNTRDRLNALYGKEQNLTISPGPSGGTEITIDTPWHTA